MKSIRPVVFIDGECVLCNRLATRLLRHDRDRIHRVATLQGRTAREMLGAAETDPSEWVIVLVDGDGTHDRSEAILRIAVGLGGSWRFGGRLARLIPRPVRDCVYDAVAHRRYHWFGKEERCRLPRPGEEDVFLP
jgi:predicted DCC family thiol-disulfide oxidoreductase YuxK